DADDIVLAWRGGPGAFPRVSFSDLYQDFDKLKRTRPANEFTGKIVIVGADASGLHDLRITPIGSLHPAPEILGTAIENLKNGRSMHYAPGGWAAAVGIALLFLIYFGFERSIDVRIIGGALAVVSAALLWASWV